MFLYYFMNPFIAAENGPFTNLNKEASTPLMLPYTKLAHLIEPDDYDINSAFYRGRVFVRLLEVDRPLVLPYATNIKLSITADDVIHS